MEITCRFTVDSALANIAFDARCHLSWRVRDDVFGNVWLCSTGITTRIITGCCSARCRSAAGGCWMSAAVPERSQPGLPGEVIRSMPSIAPQR